MPPASTKKTPIAKKKRAEKQSKHTGVHWLNPKNKWAGKVKDRSVRVGKESKQVYVGSFHDEQACADAVERKRVEIEEKIAKTLHAMAQTLPHTRNLPRRPAKETDAKLQTAYYDEKWFAARGAAAKEFGPMRYVLINCSSTASGFKFFLCCQHNDESSGKPCTQVAKKDGKHCIDHGGGPRLGDAGSDRCSLCKSSYIGSKRQLRNDGSGLCPGCEARLTDEANANGSEVPAKGKRWEDVVFDQLLPLITYADGTPFPPDQRDERKGGGLGTSKAKTRGRECDTTTNRFPDSLWILRNEHGHGVLALGVEPDEHSHGGREPTCESAKIYDTNWSVQQKLGYEGAARGSFVAKRPMVPYIMIKVNTNAYDGPRTSLKKRVKAVAELLNSYAHMDAEAIAKLQTHAPIVHVMYYHSKQGAANLAHLADVAAAAGWDYTVH